MTEKTPLGIVLEKEEHEQEAITKRLERALEFVQQERSQLEKLQEYENEYLHNIEQHQQKWSSAQMNHYRSFCYKLNDATKNQAKKIGLAEKAVAQLRQQLYEQQHKVSVLENLIIQQRIELVQHQDKKLQKELDEHSSRRLYYSSDIRH